MYVDFWGVRGFLLRQEKGFQRQLLCLWGLQGRFLGIRVGQCLEGVFFVFGFGFLGRWGSCEEIRCGDGRGFGFRILLRGRFGRIDWWFFQRIGKVGLRFWMLTCFYGLGRVSRIRRFQFFQKDGGDFWGGYFYLMFLCVFNDREDVSGGRIYMFFLFGYSRRFVELRIRWEGRIFGWGI